MTIALSDTLKELKPKKKRNAQPEYELCKALKTQLDWLEIARKLDCVWFHIPNGGVRLTMIQGARLRAIGLRAGVADYCFVRQGKCYFVEMKAGKNDQQPVQVEFQNKCGWQKTPYAICRSVKDVLDRLELWGILKP